MEPTPPELPRPFIFGYSLILPALWIVVSVLGSIVAPGRRLGIVGTALLFMGAAALTCWLFAKRHRRDLSKAEYWRLIVFSASWAILLELFVLFAVVVLPQFEAGHVQMGPLLFAVPFTVALDFLFVWGAFRQTGRKVAVWYLEKERPDQSKA